MVYQRQMGEPIRLDAALPKLGPGTLQPGNYDEAIRRRLGTIDASGRDQTLFENQQASKRQQSAYQAALQGINSSQGQNIGPGGKWLNPLGPNFRPEFEWGQYGGANNRHGTHKAYDFAAPTGTRVMSPFGATVVETGFQKGGFGNNVRVRFDNGTYGIFGHLSAFAKGLKSGQRLTPGQILGYVGSTGRSTGSHLHFETRYSLYDPGTSFNPGSWFGW
jgi:murein DD-endopeptidase MepM/ murein hydrolase activator NlpD